MPPKSLSIYRGYTAQQLKDRASIPLAANITVYASYIDCLYIDLVRIRNILGASQWDIVALYQHTNVNPWSNFGPILRSISSKTIVFGYRNSPNYGDFAGYNHSALAPTWINKSTTEQPVSVNSGSTVQIFGNVYIGEVDYYAEMGIQGVCFALYDGTSLVGYTIVAISSATNQIEEVGVLTPVITYNRTFTFKILFIDNTSTFAVDEELAAIPNVTNATCTVNVRLPNYIVDIYTEGFLTEEYNQPFSVPNDCTFNASNGAFTYPNLYKNSNSYGLYIVVSITNLETSAYEEIVLFNADYYAYDTIWGNTVYFTSAPFSSYGHKIELLMEASGM